MHGIAEGKRLKLLEANLTPSLAEIANFAERYRAIGQAGIPALIFPAKQVAGVDDQRLASKFNTLQDTVMQLAAAATALTNCHEHLEAMMSSPTPEPSHQPFTYRFAAPRLQNSAHDGFRPQPWQNTRSRKNKGSHCFNCNGLDHCVNSCPYVLRFTHCSGWSHEQHQCANRHAHSSQSSSISGRSLNFKSVSQYRAELKVTPIFSLLGHPQLRFKSPTSPLFQLFRGFRLSRLY